MLHGSLGSIPAVGTFLIKHLVFIRYAITVRIAISDHIHGIGFAYRNPFIEWEDHSGKVEVVDEDGGLIHPSVSVQIH